jgi:hypothetical protein
MIQILYDLIPTYYRAFLDDITVKDPTITYRDNQVIPGIRRYVIEYIQNIDKVLVNIELVGYTINAVKSQWYQESIPIIRYIYRTNSYRLNQTKIIKILKWERYKDISKVRSFLGIVTFYRIWVEYFTIIALPLIKLLRKGVIFE